MVAGLGKTADVITVTSKADFKKKNGKDKKGEEVIQPICYLTRRREGRLLQLHGLGRLCHQLYKQIPTLR